MDWTQHFYIFLSSRCTGRLDECSLHDSGINLFYPTLYMTAAKQLKNIPLSTQEKTHNTFLLFCHGSFDATEEYLPPTTGKEVKAQLHRPRCGAFTSLESGCWRKAVKGSAKCFGALCTHKVIDSQDSWLQILGRRKWDRWSNDLVFYFIKCEIYFWKK